MKQKTSLKKRSGILHSRKALAVPVTYLILLSSLILLISLTYSFAVAKISARGSIIRTSVAEQNMLILDDSIRSVAWSFDASKTVYMDDCGGSFKTLATAKNLIINFTDEQSFSDIVFDSSIGQAIYELESSESNSAGLFIRGDDRAIVNQSGSTMAQVYVAASGDSQELTLCYRPLATVAVIGTSNNKPLNLIRIYIISLNSSQSLILQESFYLKVTAVNVATIATQYEFNQSISLLTLKTVFDNTQGIVQLPISSNSEGATVNLEVVICNIKLQKAEV